MKKINKILPLLGTVAIGAIPFATTSCSNVWTDLIGQEYKPPFTALVDDDTPDKLGEITALEAKDLFEGYFLKNPGNLIHDFYWGASFFGRIGLPALEEVEVKTFLMQLSDMGIRQGKSESILHAPIISYHSKAQLELKHPGLDQSYAINTYDLDWKFSNLEVVPVYYKTIGDVQCWSISPIKFDSYNAYWWRELEGNEQIKFDFRAVFKGYGKNGGQNYIRETSEAAIIDEAHRYAPELNEIYTNVMLFDTYSLSNLRPRMLLNNANVPAVWDGSKYVSDDLGFTLGQNTYDNYGDCTLSFSVVPNSQFVYSPFGSEITVSELDLHTPTKTKISTLIPSTAGRKYSFIPTFKVTGTPLVGDRFYYVVEMDCDASGSSFEKAVNWTEYLFVSTLITTHD